MQYRKKIVKCKSCLSKQNDCPAREHNNWKEKNCNHVYCEHEWTEVSKNEYTTVLTCGLSVKVRMSAWKTSIIRALTSKDMQFQ